MDRNPGQPKELQKLAQERAELVLIGRSLSANKKVNEDIRRTRSC